MSTFGNNRHNGPPATPPPPETGRSKSYVEEASDRVKQLHKTMNSFLAFALRQGTPVARLPELVAYTMDMEMLPKVISSAGENGTVVLTLLDGIVPEDGLKLARIPSRAEVQRMLDRGGTGLSDLITLSSTAHSSVGQGGFTIEAVTLPLVEQPGDPYPVDHEMLAKIDAHLYPPGLASDAP